MRDKNLSHDAKIHEFMMCEFDDFKKALKSAEDLRILEFHLLFENMLEKIIVRVLKRGDRLIDKGNLTFSQKLTLVHSFDIITDSYIQALRQLNSLRNQLSHDRDAIITLDNFDLIGRPLGKAYSDIKRKHKNDYLFKVVWDTLFLLNKGIARELAAIEFGAEKVEAFLRRGNNVE